MGLKQMIVLDNVQWLLSLSCLLVAFIMVEALLFGVFCRVSTDVESPHRTFAIVALFAAFTAMFVLMLMFFAHFATPVGDGSTGQGTAVGDVSGIAYRSEMLNAKSGEKQLVCVYTPSDDEEHRKVMSELSSRLGASVTWIESGSDVGKGIASAAGANMEPFIAVVSWHRGSTGVSYDVSDMTYCCENADDVMAIAPDLWQKVDDMSLSAAQETQPTRLESDSGWIL